MAAPKASNRFPSEQTTRPSMYRSQQTLPSTMDRDDRSIADPDTEPCQWFKWSTEKKDNDYALSNDDNCHKNRNEVLKRKNSQLCSQWAGVPAPLAPPKKLRSRATESSEDNSSPPLPCVVYIIKYITSHTTKKRTKDIYTTYNPDNKRKENKPDQKREDNKNVWYKHNNISTKIGGKNKKQEHVF